MNVPDTKFSRNTMKLLNHNASTLMVSWIIILIQIYTDFKKWLLK